MDVAALTGAMKNLTGFCLLKGALLRIKRSIDQMDSVTVHVTHGKNVYADVRVDPSCGTEEFRATLYSLTGNDGPFGAVFWNTWKRTQEWRDF
jgi:hypothetical protein